MLPDPELCKDSENDATGMQKASVRNGARVRNAANKENRYRDGGGGEDESTFVSSTPGRKSQEENGWEGRRRMRKRDGERQRARASSFGEKTRRWNMHAARPNSNDDRDNIMVSL